MVDIKCNNFSLKVHATLIIPLIKTTLNKQFYSYNSIDPFKHSSQKSPVIKSFEIENKGIKKKVAKKTFFFFCHVLSWENLFYPCKWILVSEGKKILKESRC